MSNLPVKVKRVFRLCLVLLVVLYLINSRAHATPFMTKLVCFADGLIALVLLVCGLYLVIKSLFL